MGALRNCSGATRLPASSGGRRPRRCPPRPPPGRRRAPPQARSPPPAPHPHAVRPRPRPAATSPRPLALHSQSPAVRVTYAASTGTVSETGLYTAPADTGAATITVQGAPSTDTIRVAVVRSAVVRSPPPADTGPRPKDGLWLDEDFS